jgi:hypothetical protein
MLTRGKIAAHFQQQCGDDSGRSGPAIAEVVVAGDVVGCGGGEVRDPREEGAIGRGPLNPLPSACPRAPEPQSAARAAGTRAGN